MFIFGQLSVQKRTTRGKCLLTTNGKRDEEKIVEAY